MEAIVELILHVADTDATILLTGATGTGKGYFAKRIHESSKRRDEPLVSINCGAIPAELLESELFGYEAGAFTGAKETGKARLFELGKSGTIFLDEIGDMSLDLQVKLLSVLDDKEFRRVGGNKKISIEGRFIAATNKDLKKLIEEGKFREDLYYRLNVVNIEIPSLKDRLEDLIPIANSFLKKFNEKYNTNKVISEEGYLTLLNYDYPGNIRELENIIERLVIISSNNVINEKSINNLLNNNNVNVDLSSQEFSLKGEVEKLEKKIIKEAMEKYKTTREAAKILKIDQSTVVKKMKRYGLSDE